MGKMAIGGILLWDTLGAYISGIMDEHHLSRYLTTSALLVDTDVL